ncbi:hypothetical protein FACS1894180_4400 [Bacteroidia bacterium]|nr:hypothetical protein FACS1894180_4400 [Bacteroidia bacterium]
MYNKKDLINLTDKLWQNYKNIFEPQNRKRKHSLRLDISKDGIPVMISGKQYHNREYKTNSLS